MWQTLESDPGLFTELVEKWGVQNVEFNEVFSLDVPSFRSLGYKDLYGAIFLFNYTKSPNPANTNFATNHSLWFSNQIAENSCATNALLSLVLNTPQIELSDELEQLKSFTAELDSQTSGEVVGSAQFFQQCHNSMAKPVSFIQEGPAPPTQDAFHFITFVQQNGNLYELDGLKQAPINHGPLGNLDFESKLSEVLQNKINEFQNEMRFSVMLATNDLRQNASPEEIVTQNEKRAVWAKDNKMRSAQLTGLAMEMLKQMSKVQNHR